MTILCPNVRLDAPASVKLSTSERTLVCGDPLTPAWSHIPLRQAAYFLQIFLNQRGYHDAVTDFREGTLTVHAGALSTVREVEVVDAPIPLHPGRYWKIYNKPLTPKALDDLDRWIKHELARRGYPCVDMQTRADPTTGLIRIDIEHAPALVFPPIQTEPIPQTQPGIEKRYYAFHPGDPYDVLDLELSARRMINDEIVLNTDFAADCHPDGTVSVKQTTVPGDPRLISAGVGFDTEELAIVEGTWKHSRIGRMASALRVNLRASYRQQTADATFNWYYAPHVVRHYLRSVLSFERQNERRYDTRTFTAVSGPAWTRDAGSLYFSYWSGLSLSRTDTVRGLGPSSSRALALEGALDVSSHDYEYYKMTPRSGFSLDLDLTRSEKHLGSDFSATRATVGSTMLWNIASLDPPVFILGLRTDASATLLGNDTHASDIPVTYRNFLGGSRNLRGFGREALPANSHGALSSLYTGLEGRLASVIPFGVEPIVFVDVGKLGGVNRSVDRSLFWSPGTGINWGSPIGTVRATVAYGLIRGPAAADLAYLSRWQFYLSYGEQF